MKKILRRRRQLIALLKQEELRGGFGNSEKERLSSLAAMVLRDRQRLAKQGVDPDIAIRAARNREVEISEQKRLTKKKRKGRKKRKICRTLTTSLKSGGVGMYSLASRTRNWKA